MPTSWASVMPSVSRASIQRLVNHTFMWPSAGLDHSNPDTAVNDPSTSWASASARVLAKPASSSPSRDRHSLRPPGAGGGNSAQASPGTE